MKFGSALMCLHDIGLNHIHRGQQYNGAESYTQELQQNIDHRIGQKDRCSIKKGADMISEEKTTKTADPTISRDEAIGILNTPDDQLDELVARAGELREKYKGKHVGIHILTNARSGNCSQDCAYCA